MDYSEFLEKSGMYVTTEEYEQIIKPIYLEAPSDIVGNEVTMFCEWLKDSEFSIAQLRQIARIAKAYGSAVSKLVAAQNKVSELDVKAGVLESENQKLQNRLDAVIEVVGDESLVERMVDDIDTEGIIDAWVRARNTRRQ